MMRVLSAAGVAALALMLHASVTNQPARLLTNVDSILIMGGVEPCYKYSTQTCERPPDEEMSCNPDCATSDSCCSGGVCNIDAGYYVDRTVLSATTTLNGGKKNKVVGEPITCYSSYFCREAPCIQATGYWQCQKGSWAEMGPLVWPEIPSGAFCEIEPYEPQ